MKEKVNAKKETYIALVGSGIEEEKEVNVVRYKIAKKEAKKSVRIPKNNAYDRLYQRLESKEEDKEVLKLARDMDKETRYLGSGRWIKDEDEKV